MCEAQKGGHRVSVAIEAPVPHASVVPDLLVPKEAAAILRESVKTTYRRCDPKDKHYDASFPVIRKPGGTLLIPRVALEKWARNYGQGITSPLRITAIPGTSTDKSAQAEPGALNSAEPVA